MSKQKLGNSPLPIFAVLDKRINTENSKDDATMTTAGKFGPVARQPVLFGFCTKQDTLYGALEVVLCEQTQVS